MGDVTTTVRRLITLALNAGANEHEARNAAMKACQLIHEHQLLEGRRPRRSVALEDLFTDAFNSVHFRADQRSKPPPAVHPEKMEPDPAAVRYVHYGPEAANCVYCRGHIPICTVAVQSSGRTYHAFCYDKAVE